MENMLGRMSVQKSIVPANVVIHAFPISALKL